MKIKKILLSIWIVVIALTAYYLYTHHITPTLLRGYFAQLGPWAILIYIIAYTIRPIVFFPSSIMTPLSALLFGPYLGWIFTYIGETFSATVAFFIAKYFGKDLIAKFEKQNQEKGGKTTANFILKYKERLEKNGFETVIFLRLVPLFPFDFVNYACGLSDISYRTYLIATMIGVIPGLTAYIFLGGSLMNPYFILPTIILFVLLTVLARYLRKKRSELV